MFARNRPTHLIHALPPPRLAVAILASVALLSTACSDSASHLTSPQALAHSRDALSAGGTFSFPVLANAAVTCTDGNITGEVATFMASPTGSVTQTSCPITGSLHLGDAAAQQAYNDFLGSYAAIAPKPGDVCTTLTGTLDGVSLAPGDYCFDVAATVTGVLTLDGPSDGIWNVKIGTSGTGALTGTNFSVTMAGGGQACNVTWWVADATTMTTSNIQGNILAGRAITLTGGTFIGHAASKADVTVTGTAVSGCSAS
jgi:hypothetical protein